MFLKPEFASSNAIPPKNYLPWVENNLQLPLQHFQIFRKTPAHICHIWTPTLMHVSTVTKYSSLPNALLAFLSQSKLQSLYQRNFTQNCNEFRAELLLWLLLLCTFIFTYFAFIFIYKECLFVDEICLLLCCCQCTNTNGEWRASVYMNKYVCVEGKAKSVKWKVNDEAKALWISKFVLVCVRVVVSAQLLACMYACV